jgi:PKD repeat protein/pimeloyl-ACP methyl ester carboxylesterase
MRMFSFLAMIGFLAMPAHADIPYPIILVHGIVGSYETFEGCINGLEDIFDVPAPLVYHACLNHDQCDTTAFFDSFLGSGDVDEIGFTAYGETGLVLNPASNNRIFVINFDDNVFQYIDGHGEHDGSNQSALFKQGYALSMAIERVLEITGLEKVILVGHSMGGLAIREYLQRRNELGQHRWWVDRFSLDGHKVAQVVTTGTPHLGSNAGLDDPTCLFGRDYRDNFYGLNNEGEGLRDLRYSFDCYPQCAVGDPIGIYLFGGDEYCLFEPDDYGPDARYFNVDIDCNGLSNDPIVGLNQGTRDNPAMPLPAGIRYTWIRNNSWFGESVRQLALCDEEDDTPGDGCVMLSRQYLHNAEGEPLPIGLADTLLTSDMHNLGLDNCNIMTEGEDIFTLARALDEPDSPDSTFAININRPVQGVLTRQPGGSIVDNDCFCIHMQSYGSLRYLVTGGAGILGISILNQSGQLLEGELSEPRVIERNLPPGTYYLNVSGLANAASWQTPYEISCQWTGIEMIADFSAEPLSGEAPLTVQFTDSSIGPIVQREWDFDLDGVTDSEETHPTWTYEISGIYSVRLTVTDTIYTTSTLRTNYIQVDGNYYPELINAAEYFFDLDPGQGLGHRVNLSPTQHPQVAQEISTDGMVSGFHTLYWRFRSQGGIWGMPQSRAFYISPESSPSGTPPLIATAEYYLDADPGQGQGTPFDVADAGQVAVASSLPGLTADPGFHTLYWRFRSDHGIWGMPQGRAFYVSPESSPSGTPPLITAAEYYLDSDPGQGAGTSVDLADSSHILLATTLSDVSTEPGFHTLYWRFRSDHGVWGMPQGRAFYVSPSDVDQATLQAAEFFLDVDPGQGNGVPMQAVDGAFDEREEEVEASWTVQTTAGEHQLGIRFQSDRDVWGQPLFAAFTVVAEPGAIVDLTIRYESGALVLSWSPVPGISEYRLYSNDQGGYQVNSLLATTSSTNHTITVLPTDGRSVFQVRSFVPTNPGVATESVVPMKYKMQDQER